MRVVQKALADHFFKKAIVLLLPEKIEIVSDREADKGLFIVIEPGIQRVQAVDEALRICAEVRLAVTELVIVDPRLQRTAADAGGRDVREGIPDRGNKLLLPLRIRVLGNDRIAGLADLVFKDRIDVLAQPPVAQGLANGRALGVAQRIVEDPERHVPACVQPVGERRHVPGQEGLALRILLGKDRIDAPGLHGLCKRRFRLNRGVDVQPVKMGQIMLVDPFEPLRHVHVAVEIDIAVGRMIVTPVEVQIGLVGQIRDAGRVPAGFIRVGRVRVE